MALSDDELLRRPIIVLGSGRSGMNFLGDTIARHPDLAIANEPRLIWKHGNDKLSDMMRPEDARPEVIADIRAQFANMIREQGKKRLVDVTPGNAVRLGFVDRVFPDCQFVHFIRDGVDNVLSMRRFYAVHARKVGADPDPDHESAFVRRARQFRIRQVPHLALEVVRHLAPDWMLPVIGPPVLGVRLPAMSAMRREMDLIDVCFLQWRTSVEGACFYGRRLPANRYMECRIETFGEQDIREIFEFLDMDLPESVLDYVRRKFDSKRLGPALEDAFPEEIERLKIMVEPTMQWVDKGLMRPSRQVEPSFAGGGTAQ